MHTPSNRPAVTPVPSLSTTPEATPEARKTRRLADPALRDAVHRTLKKHAPARERDDLLQDTLLATWKSPHLPDEDEAFVKYTCGIARRLAKRLVQKEARRLEHHAESFDPQNEAHVGASPADLEARLVARAQLVALGGKVHESEKRAYGWLLRNALGESLYEVAGEAGLPYMNVYKATERLRERLAKAARFFGFLALLRTSSLLVRGYFSGESPVGAAPGAHPVPVPGLSPGLPVAYLVAYIAACFVLGVAVFVAVRRTTRARQPNEGGAHAAL